MWKRNDSGQALLELALVIPILLTFVFGLVDFGRAMYDMEVITNLAGEGSSLASRGTSAADTVTAVLADADINMTAAGCVIVTTIKNPNGTTNPRYAIQTQATGGAGSCAVSQSQVGQCQPSNGSCTGTATLPATMQAVLNLRSQTIIAVTEITFTYHTITPIGYLLHKTNWLPSSLYRAAFY